MTRQELNELRDRLYVLAETVKDVERDLTDDEADDERRLLNVLLYAAKQAYGVGMIGETAQRSARQQTSARPERAAVGRHYRRNPPAQRSCRSPVPPIMPLM